jgi:hypothetical protein
MEKQELSRIHEEVALTVLRKYFKECSLDDTNKSNSFGRIIASLLAGETSFVMIHDNLVGITGYFNHRRGSSNPPKRYVNNKYKKLSKQKTYNH